MPLNRPRILLADPYPGHRAQFTGALAVAGYHVVEIASGHGLLETLARHFTGARRRPVVVVASVSRSDVELLRVVMALADSGRSPPIVALGRDRGTVRQLATHVPSSFVLPPETTLHGLIDAVDRALASIPTVPLTVMFPRIRSHNAP